MDVGRMITTNYVAAHPVLLYKERPRRNIMQRYQPTFHLSHLGIDSTDPLRVADESIKNSLIGILPRSADRSRVRHSIGWRRDVAERTGGGIAARW